MDETGGRRLKTLPDAPARTHISQTTSLGLWRNIAYTPVIDLGFLSALPFKGKNVAMNVLVLLRHGQSQWNLENRFTGLYDVELTAKGEEEARAAGEALSAITFDTVFSSVLKRANRTALIALEAAGGKAPKDESGNIILTRDPALNERDYGDLVGLNKAETAEKFGDEQVRLWRRSYDVQPPGGESLADCVARVRPYFDAEIKPRVDAGENVLVAAHGNSLRGMLVALGEYGPEEIPGVEIPTGAPLVFEFENGVKQRSFYIQDQ